MNGYSSRQTTGLDVGPLCQTKSVWTRELAIGMAQ